MRTALRTAIATALFAGVAITPALAAGTAFAADGPAAPASAAAEQQATKGELVRTETLYNGNVVKVYKLGPTWYRAETFKQGQSLGSVEANSRPAAGNDNGNFVVLFEDGRVMAWRGNFAQLDGSGTYRLADGTLLELDKQPHKAGLQLIENGKGRGFTYVGNGQNRRVFQYGKAVVVLEHDGGFAAYIPGSKKQGTPEYLGKGIVTPPSDKPVTPVPQDLKPGKPVTVGSCIVNQVIPSVFGEGWTVVLANRLDKGPTASLMDPSGKIMGTVDTAHPVFGPYGLRIDGANTTSPRIGQRTQGGDTPYRWSDFPKLPKGCVAPKPGKAVVTGDCTVEQVISSVFGEGWSVTLTNDLRKGPKAVLRSPAGMILGTADRARPDFGAYGLKIKGANTTTPRIGQRTQGGVDTPYRWSDFPKLPKGCDKGAPTPAPSATTGNTGTTTNTGQTSVIPRGGVAAGAEPGAVETDNSALIAAGAGAGALGAAGIGFVVLRRRAAARV
ncbi:hypothetical protein ACFVZH_10175 [Streptomyces sp. NPDC059534]|uniref:hypothetical protein n=1 Tax=Streptomyces sp. NPDC059534 TaxID=3346859 RepID=UPI00369CA675